MNNIYPTNAWKPSVHERVTRWAYGLLVCFLCTWGVQTWAQEANHPRPTLEQFIRTAQLPVQTRLWARSYANIAKSPLHPLHSLIARIDGANDAELMAILVQSYSDLTDAEATELRGLLETPLGQWIVESTIWELRLQCLSSTERGSYIAAHPQDPAPRQLSPTEIEAIAALGPTPHWKALRRASAKTLLSGELMMTLDWPMVMTLVWDYMKPPNR